VVGRDEALAVPGIEGLEVTIPIGGRVVGPPEGDRYLGFLFARTDGPAEAALALRQSYSKLSIEVEPNQG
jgi:hypothetical protein